MSRNCYHLLWYCSIVFNRCACFDDYCYWHEHPQKNKPITAHSDGTAWTRDWRNGRREWVVSFYLDYVYGLHGMSSDVCRAWCKANATVKSYHSYLFNITCANDSCSSPQLCEPYELRMYHSNSYFAGETLCGEHINITKMTIILCFHFIRFSTWQRRLLSEAMKWQIDSFSQPHVPLVPPPSLASTLSPRLVRVVHLRVIVFTYRIYSILGSIPFILFKILRTFCEASLTRSALKQRFIVTGFTYTNPSFVIVRVAETHFAITNSFWKHHGSHTHECPFLPNSQVNFVQIVDISLAPYYEENERKTWAREREWERERKGYWPLLAISGCRGRTEKYGSGRSTII